MTRATEPIGPVRPDPRRVLRAAPASRHAARASSFAPCGAGIQLRAMRRGHPHSRRRRDRSASHRRREVEARAHPGCGALLDGLAAHRLARSHTVGEVMHPRHARCGRSGHCGSVSRAPVSATTATIRHGARADRRREARFRVVRPTFGREPGPCLAHPHRRAARRRARRVLVSRRPDRPFGLADDGGTAAPVRLSGWRRSAAGGDAGRDPARSGGGPIAHRNSPFSGPMRSGRAFPRRVSGDREPDRGGCRVEGSRTPERSFRQLSAISPPCAPH